MNGIIVDLFAGGGGASEGIRLALGRCPDVAINHDAAAIAMHEANHPSTLHLREDIRTVSPTATVQGRPVALLWASPDCKHFSRAKGGKPREKAIRSLAWAVVDWAREVRPAVICLENVSEFQTWGPLLEDGRVDPARAGETFREFVKALSDLGYAVDWRVLNAADFGAPTSRKRLFLIARCDGFPLTWPTPSHGPGRIPYRTAAECIDWSIPVPSIFVERPVGITDLQEFQVTAGRRCKPLAEKTMARIAKGIQRFVFDAPRPFIVSHYGQSVGQSIDDPLPTVTAGGMGHQSLVVPSLIQTGYGERKGQAPRVLDLHSPIGTLVAGGQKHALVAAFLTKFYGTSTGSDLREPMPTTTAGGTHAGLVAAFLAKHYGGVTGQDLFHPLGTITAVDHHSLVTVSIEGEPHYIADIGMRMLQPRELATAQGFRADYMLTGTKTQQVARIGNSVCPPIAAAIVGALLPRQQGVAA